MSDAVSPVIAEAGRQLRAPWAASVAGILFSVLFTLSLLLLRSAPLYNATDAELAATFAAGEDLPAVIGALYLAPFAGIAFMWFIAVIRDQIGEREDRFFATVFFGSGLLFVALLFVAAAVASIPLVAYRYLQLGPPTAAEMDTTRSLSYALLFAFSSRAAAVFLFATATIGVRTGTFPRWFGRTGYALGVIMLLVVTVFDLVVLLFPAWVAVVSLFILRRERQRVTGEPRTAAS